MIQVAYQANHGGFSKSALAFMSALIRTFKIGKFDDSIAIEYQIKREQQRKEKEQVKTQTKKPSKKGPRTEYQKEMGIKNINNLKTILGVC